jgi:photosystem II stability/assembly factor-like uncharacterized protein
LGRQGRADAPDGCQAARVTSSQTLIRTTRALLAALVLFYCVALGARQQAVKPDQPTAAPVDPRLLQGLQWRSIGPAMFGGRVVDVAGVPGKPDLLFVGAASSGLYRSTNGGITFESVFNDGNTLSIGAIAVQPDRPDVIYVGTGEGFPRNSISFGDGIYKTTDGGKTWTHLGLTDAERFARIVIHPTNPQIVLAAAMGHAFGANTERGVYRTSDGGKTWARTLFVNDSTGASDVQFDPKDPSIVYAGMYDYERKPWTFRSGGAGSGLYRSADGGATWTRLTDPALRNGLPGGKLLGRIGIAVSRSNPGVVYALIESQEEGVLWRSDDRGLHWKIVNSDHRINNRPFYYTQVRVDPEDENRIYTLSGTFNVSTDGGRTFGPGGGRMFGDHHALWIDPLDPMRLLCGTDGGFFISHDYGRNWDFVNNMPLAQAYHVGVDMADPYNVLGGFQDHEIWRGPNERWNEAGVREGDWRRLRYMADGQNTVPDPRDPNRIYYNGHFGDITWIDMRNSEERYIQPYPVGPSGEGADAELFRFNWNSPIHMSPSDPDVVYYGGNVLFRTTDRGTTWKPISPDLTTNDKEKQRPSGGPITFDNTRAETHCTILSIAESPRDRGVIWAGTDDGNVQLTRDGGAHWTNVAPNMAGAPRFSWVSSISASNVDAGTAYVSIDQHRLNDFAPYVFATNDYGRTWRKISSGLKGYAHVVMEDPKEPRLIYTGTELGIFGSFDRGASWTDLRLGLPRLAVVDMKVHPRDNDLVIATHARGFYILDDVTPLQALAKAQGTGTLALYRPMRATRYTPASDTSVLGNRVWVARNKPYGALINYYLPETPGNEVLRLAILDASGRTVRTLQGTNRAGINRVVWDLHEASACPATAGRGARGAGGGRGRGGDGASWIRALPGEYKVRLTALGRTAEESLTVRLDPNVTATAQDLDVYYREVKKIESIECSTSEAMSRIATLDGQLAGAESKTTDAQIKSDGESVRKELRAIAVELNGDPREPDHLNLRGKINWLTIQVGNYTGRPTPAQIEWIDRFSADRDRLVAHLEAVLHSSVAKLNQRLTAAGITEVR